MKDLKATTPFELMNHPRRTTSRKRLRVSLVSMFCAALCQTSSGFVAPAAVQPMRATATTTFAAPRIAPSLSAASSDDSSMWTDPKTKRLSDEEQQELLRRVVECRRIKQIEADIMVTLNIKTRTVSTLQLSRAAGYGDELTELEEAVAAGDAARERLVTTNMGLVVYCVNDIIKTKGNRLQSVTRDDLVQEGAIGLARAVDRWNPAVGGKLSTYAFYWIRASALRCIAERDDLMRVPEHVSTAIRKVGRAAQTLGLYDDAWKEAATAKALAEAAGLSDKQLYEAMQVWERRNVGILSFESWMQLGKDYETDLLTSNVSVDNNESKVDNDHMKQTLSRFLRPREMEALSWRYGLNEESACTTINTPKRDYLADAEVELYGSSSSKTEPMPVKGKWGEAMSFVEVGKHMQVSAEYGRRLCHAALDKLRRAAAEGALEATLLV